MADHRSAYEGLLKRYVAPLRRLAWSYAHNPAGRDDLFQEIAMALWTALPRFRGDSSERTWVYRVAHNTAISFAASRRRHDDREQPGEITREPVAAAQQEGDAIEGQRRERLWAAVQELRVTERQIVVLHLEGLSGRAARDSSECRIDVSDGVAVSIDAGTREWTAASQTHESTRHCGLLPHLVAKRHHAALVCLHLYKVQGDVCVEPVKERNSAINQDGHD